MVDPNTKGKGVEPEKSTVRQKKVTRYCEAVGDMNPKYVDENRAGGTVMPPAYASALVIGVMTKIVQDSRANLGKLLHASQEYTYFKPVRMDEKLSITGRIADIYEKGNKDWIVGDAEAHNEAGEKVLSAKITCAVRR